MFPQPMPRQSTRADLALATVLRRRREDRHETQEALGYRSGTTSGTIARLELVQSSPSWATVSAVADAMDLSMQELGRLVDAEREKTR
jgi:transcriptional regulator with XRE-family HTH domain